VFLTEFTSLYNLSVSFSLVGSIPPLLRTNNTLKLLISERQAVEVQEPSNQAKFSRIPGEYGTEKYLHIVFMIQIVNSISTNQLVRADANNTIQSRICLSVR